MKLNEVTRRRFLTTGVVGSGVATTGCTGLLGWGTDATDEPKPSENTATTPSTPAKPTEVDNIAPWELARNVDYWAWYPSEESLWSRSEEPFDFRVDTRRWMAWPTEDGSVRCLVRNDESPGNAGFFFGIGPIGGVQSITIDSETVESDGGDQKLLFAVYLDATGDAEYFEWEAAEDREAFVDVGGDIEGIGVFPAGGTFSIDDDTEMEVIPPVKDDRVRLGDLKGGVVDGVDESTEAAIQVSVIGSGPNNVEEVLIHDVTAETVSIWEPPAESWPMYAHNKFNTGNNRASHGPTGSFQAHWEFATDGAVRSSPAVMAGSVFVGSDDGHVYAIDTGTGDRRWAFETGGPVRSSPAVFHDRVIVGSDDNVIYAIDIETGEVIWELETGDRVRAPPLVDVHTDLGVADHVVAVGSYDGVMYVLEPRTGELIHRQAADGPIKESAVRVIWRRDSELVWGAEDSIRYYWIPTRPPGDRGREQSYELDAPPTAATAYTPLDMRDRENGLAIYEVPGFLTRRIAGRLANDWRFESDDEIRSSPALGPFVYTGSWDGNLYAIDRASGDPEWTFETGDKIDSSPAIAGDGVYVSSTDGHLYGLDATSGELLGSFETGAAIYSSPAVSEGTVYVGSDDGKVYALRDA